jgi:acetyl-CoA/propionyl-CoA carboxylase biotin carboxyl carrier protein
VGGKRLEVTLPAGLGGGAQAAHAGKPTRRSGTKAGGAGAAGGDALASPMQGTIVKVEVGAPVTAGAVICTIS